MVGKSARFNSIPTATGGIARAAYARAIAGKQYLQAILKTCRLTVGQIKNPNVRLAVSTQINFLNLVADALGDEFLGLDLAQSIELRELGLLYYVLASSDQLGEALRRAARYSTIHNEGVIITYRERKGLRIAFDHVGVARVSDRHQIEFIIVILLRMCRQLTGRHLSPNEIKLIHRRTSFPTRFTRLFGCDVTFGSHVDEVMYPQHAKLIPLVDADPYLNAVLVKYCDEALAYRRARPDTWELRVENAIAPLLPHGQAEMSVIAEKLGTSQRMLSRRLASEGLTFLQVLTRLRFDLAKLYPRAKFADFRSRLASWLSRSERLYACI